MLDATLRCIAAFGDEGMPTLDVEEAYRLGLIRLEQDLSEMPIYRIQLTARGRTMLGSEGHAGS